MLKPVSIAQTSFKSQSPSFEKRDYKDPLTNWPLRGAAFTNEIGEALRPIIGNFATLSWIPALLYIGADIYDKYKNDQTEYSPDSRRCLKQAVFQGMASIFLPLVAVKAGQNTFSLFGLAENEKLTFNAHDNIIDLAQKFVSNGKMHAYKNNKQECIKDFLDIVHNNIDYDKQKTKSKIIRSLNNVEDFISKKFKINTKDNIENFSKKTVNDLINMYQSLLKPTEEFKKSTHYKEFQKCLINEQTENVAIKSVLNKSLEKSKTKGKLVKTLGGFIFLGLAIKPIDKFVEEVLIGKVVGPGIDKGKPTLNFKAGFLK